LRAVKNTFFLLTVAAIVTYLYFNWDNLQVLKQVPLSHIFILIFIGLFGILINAFQFKVIANVFNIKLNFNEWFGLSSVNTMYSYLLPAKAGLAVRGLYLKKKYNFPYALSTSLLAGSYLITFLITALISTVLCAWFFSKGTLALPFFAIPVGMLMGFSALLFWLLQLNSENTTSENRIFRFIQKAHKGLQFFKNRPRSLFVLSVLQLSVIMVNTFRLAFAFYLLNIHVDFTQLLFIQSFVVFATIVTLLPANLVVKEGIVGFSAGFLGLTLESALLGALFDRVIIMLLVFLLGIIWSRILFNTLEEKTNKIGRE